MSNGRNCNPDMYYYDQDDELIGRELSEEEIKSLSRDQLLEVAIGAWRSNGRLYGLGVLEDPDGNLITYVDVHIDGQDDSSFTSQCFELSQGEDPKTLLKNKR
jgi:hypothetical protein